MNLVMLKILGFVFMIIDHLGILFDLFPLRLIGRLSFPIFAFCVANGVIYTQNRKRYLLRLLLLAIVSEIPFDLFMFGKLSFETQNVFFTLLLGAISITLFDMSKDKGFEFKSFILSFVILMLCAALSRLFNFDYCFYGVNIIYAFYFIKLSNYVGNDCSFLYVFIIYWLWRTFNGFGIIGVLSLIFVKVYDADKPFNKKINKWLYIVYPVHLIILFVLRCLL